MIDTQIERWAHMLDEAFDKSSSSIVDDVIPTNENQKFNFSDIFVDGMESKDIEALFDKIWPKWYDYFTNTINKEDNLELEGRRRDVDDWDVWSISVEDTYGGIDNMISLMFDDIQERWHGKTISLKEIVDNELSRLIGSAGENIDIDTLESNGQCIYRGSYHTGGYYPDH